MTSSPTSRTDVLVIGESLVDVVDGVPLPGGSSANVAVAIGRQGVPVTLATQFADDVYGGLLRDHFLDSRVDLVASPALRTSSATAVIGPHGDATYRFDVVWDARFDDLPQAAVVHVGSYSALDVEIPMGTLSYDVNVRPALMPQDAVVRVESIVARSTWVKASDEDLAWLYPDRSPEVSAAALLASGPAVVWVTRGERGATGFTSTGRIDVAAPVVDVVDTIGAGDTFTAGLIVGWLRWGDDWQAVGSFAADLAASTASRKGADPPWAD